MAAEVEEAGRLQVVKIALFRLSPEALKGGIGDQCAKLLLNGGGKRPIGLCEVEQGEVASGRLLDRVDTIDFRELF